jgi:hypothetical protein
MFSSAGPATWTLLASNCIGRPAAATTTGGYVYVAWPSLGPVINIKVGLRSKRFALAITESTIHQHD